VRLVAGRTFLVYKIHLRSQGCCREAANGKCEKSLCRTMKNNSTEARKLRKNSSYPKELTKTCKSSEEYNEKREEDVGDVFEAEELVNDEILARGNGMINVIAEMLFCK